VLYEERLSSIRAPELFLPEIEWNPKEDDLFFASDRIDRVFAHLVGFDGADSLLLKATDGKLQVLDAGTSGLELALCGAGDVGLDDLSGDFAALELALCGAGDKGLDDLLTELASVDDRLNEEGINAARLLDNIEGYLGVTPTTGSAGAVLADICTAVESIDATLTDVWDAGTGHYLRTHETA